MDCVTDYYEDKDLSLLKKLTLVIPTYNRNYYFSRCLWYHAHFPFAEIIVADSSPENKKVVNRETVEKVRERFGGNVRYLEFDPETEQYGGDIYKKWRDAVLLVKTPYSLFCTDREFEMPVTLCKYIQYMDKDDDIGACAARIGHINLRKNGTCNYDQLFNSDIITSDNIYERVHTVLYDIRQIVGITASIYRTDVLKYIYNTYDIKDLRFGEVVIGLSASILSRTCYFTQDIITCRDWSRYRINNVPSKSESSTIRYPPLELYLKNGLWEKYYPEFKQYIMSILTSKNVVIDETELDLAIIGYLKRSYYLPSGIWDLEAKYNYLLQVTNNFPDRIWHKLPVKVRDAICIIFKISRRYPKSCEITADIAIIITIIDSKISNHNNDLPII